MYGTIYEETNTDIHYIDLVGSKGGIPLYRKTRIVFILIFMMVFSSCDIFTKEDPGEALEPKEAIKEEQVLSDDVEKLLSQESHELQVKQIDGAYYTAADQFTKRIVEKLSENDLLQEQNSINIDYNMILKFKGYKEIYLNTEKGHFWFDKSEHIYMIRAWSDDFWKRLVLKEINGQIVYYTFEKDVLARTYLGFGENVETSEVLLYYDGDIRLQVNDKDIKVLSNVPEDCIESLIPSNQLKNDLYIKEDAQNQRYLFLIGSLYSFTNKYGSTAWLSCYEYKNGELRKVWDVGDLLSTVIVRDYSKGVLKLEMKGQGSSFSIKLRQDEIKKINEYLEVLKEVKETFIGKEDYLFFSNVTQYMFYDYNKDGTDELIVKAYLRGGAAGITDNIFFVYNFTEEGIRLEKILPARENAKLVEIF
jgi:hypothetical protein